MHTRVIQYVLVTTLVLLVACRNNEREPIRSIEPGRDTMFSLPPVYVGRNTIVRVADLDGDGWRDVALIVPAVPSSHGKDTDSLIVYRFDATAGVHRRIDAYGDFGISDLSTVRHQTFATPLILLWLDGGGNDALTFGKVVFLLYNDKLQKIAEAPWGDPQLIEIDTSLVLELHQTFSGTLPHAMALEYADSIIVIAGSNAYPADTRTLDRRITYYRHTLDSLWQKRRQIPADQWGDITSKIMSLANLLSKQQGMLQAKSALLQELRRWRLVLPHQYRQLLKDFADEFGDEFSFLR